MTTTNHPKVVLPPAFAPASASAAWIPLDGNVIDALESRPGGRSGRRSAPSPLDNLRPPLSRAFYTPAAVRRTLYLSRDVRTVRLLTLAWDTPDTVYVSGADFPPGWHECRRVNDELLDRLIARAAKIEQEETSRESTSDEWKRAGMLARAKEALIAWHESDRMIEPIEPPAPPAHDPLTTVASAPAGDGILPESEPESS